MSDHRLDRKPTVPEAAEPDNSKRPVYADVCDLHAAQAWAAGRRWQCHCPACAQAREELWEPRSTADAMVRR